MCLTCSKRGRNKTCRGLYSPAMEVSEQAGSSVRTSTASAFHQPGVTRGAGQSRVNWGGHLMGDSEMEGKHLSSKGLAWTKAGGGKVQGTFKASE